MGGQHLVTLLISSHPPPADPSTSRPLKWGLYTPVENYPSNTKVPRLKERCWFVADGLTRPHTQKPVRPQQIGPITVGIPQRQSPQTYPPRPQQDHSITELALNRRSGAHPGAGDREMDLHP